jgi:hypothetical protein
MDTGRIVQIWSSDGSLSTGYAIAPTLILASRHGMSGEQEGGKPYVLGIKDLGREPEPVQRGTIKWLGTGIDASLIELEPDHPVAGRVSTELVTFACLSFDGAVHKCSGTGFPKAVRGDNTVNNPYVYAGDMQRLEQDNYLLLQLDKPLASDTGWKGISGSAVFRGRALVGVIRHTRPQLGNDALDAESIEKAFAEPKFCALIEGAGYAGAYRRIMHLDKAAMQKIGRLVTRLDRHEPATVLSKHFETLAAQTDPWPAFVTVLSKPPQRHEYFMSRLAEVEIRQLFKVEADPSVIFPSFEWPSAPDIDAEAEHRKWIEEAWPRLFSRAFPPPNPADPKECADKLHAALQGTPSLCGLSFSVTQGTVEEGTGHGALLEKWWTLWAEVKKRGLNRRFIVAFCVVDAPSTVSRGFLKKKPKDPGPAWVDLYATLNDQQKIYSPETLVLKDIPPSELDPWIEQVVRLLDLPPGRPGVPYCEDIEDLKMALVGRFMRSFSMHDFDENLSAFLARRS